MTQKADAFIETAGPITFSCGEKHLRLAMYIVVPLASLCLGLCAWTYGYATGADTRFDDRLRKVETEGSQITKLNTHTIEINTGRIDKLEAEYERLIVQLSEQSKRMDSLLLILDRMTKPIGQGSASPSPQKGDG